LPYIGNTPADKFLTLAKQSFSTSATTSYTLDSAVSSTQDIALFINNVRQSPVDAYTVSGTALTLTSATAGTDEMYCVYLGKTVGTVSPASDSVTTAMLQSNAVNNAKMADDAIGLAELSATGTPSSSNFLRGDNAWASAGGITVADFWLLTSSFQGDADPISSNLSKAVSVTSNVTTESSGIFSFPLTGFYLVTWNVVIRLDSGSEKGNFYTRFTTDNSSYDFFSAPITMTSIGTNSYTSTMSQRIVDVTDTSLCKIKFGVDVSNTDTYTRGGSAPGETANRFTFIRLGDT